MENRYMCPMHPDVVENAPGICPECGMALLEQKEKKNVHGHASHSEHASHKAGTLDKHAGHSANIFKAKFWVSLVLSVPIVAYSDIAQNLLRYTAPDFPGAAYLPFILASVVFFYGGWIFIASAYRELRARLPGMMTLIALAISVAYLYSVAITLLGKKEGALYWELTTLITIMLLGHWMEMRAVSGAQGALKELSKLLPDEAEVIKGGTTKVIPLSELGKGDVVLVKPGGRVPADGIVESGTSEVNESMATGESKPVQKKTGDAVIAGTTNGDGSLKIAVTKIGEETFLAGVMRLVAEAQSSKSRLQMLSDRAAYYLTIVAVVTGGITLAAWLALADAAFAINRMVAVLVIACPHALGLAIPLVASISTTKAARNGFLVKQRLALEAARNIGIVLFDKTGTLTKGEFGITETIKMTDDYDDDKLLQLAASVNAHSEHPLAKAMISEARARNISLSEASGFQRIPGMGVRADIYGEEVLIGSMSLAMSRGIILSNEAMLRADVFAKQGKTVNVVAKSGVALGLIAFADIIREESREAVNALRSMGVKTAMITGDADDVAKWVAGELGIDEYFARVMPGEKAEIVRKLQNSKHEARNSKQIQNSNSKNSKHFRISDFGFRNSHKRAVAFVGDGVNDAPALTQADLGIAIGAGTNVAIESAGIILVRNDPRDIPKIIKLSRLTYAKMIQNLFWAAGYNVFAIPLAAGVLFSRGIVLQPALAAVLMSLSTIIVAINAILLKRVKI